MESDDEKKDSKTVVIPKEVKSPEPSQNKIEQEHTVALVVTLTDQTMAESIGEEKKESTKQVEKKEEPKVQDNEILCENNGREEFIIDTRIQHFPPHDNAPTKSTSLNTASSTGHPGLNLCSDLFELGVFLLVHGPDDHTCENRKGGESKILGRSLRSEQGVTVNEKQTRKGMRGRTNIDALLMRLDIGLDIATSTGHSLTGQDSLSSTVSSLVCHRSTPSSIPHVDEYLLPAVYVIFSSSFVPKDMSADGYWEEDGKNTANANTLLFSSLSFAESLQITSCSFSSSMNDSILLDKLRI
ncbi:hypothetical protein BLNAU_23888 [Blattamonas nauphoetae]|uniref:Uncharacterized protein n=1 Tax=Blattamonas nauphoetae TaxID=2049346 RepID=A0ABQ9WRW1_9EUKA|nr:hypothetical protein BLNAU_23888 [Blattamonas nauphoetae]